jgi:hypothetical protein
MIHGDVTLQQVDEVYQRMSIKELVIIPWYEKVVGYQTKRLAGLITGYIDVYDRFPDSKSAFLEHFIVLPEARNKIQVMQQMPKLAATLLAGKVERILLCIAHYDVRREHLCAWARRCGYAKFGERDAFDWFIKPLSGEQHGKSPTEDAGSSDTDPSPAAASGP